MTLCDTGPIVALINVNDPRHADCNQALSSLPDEPLATTWPCLTEAMHLLDRMGGFRLQDRFWDWVARSALEILPADPADWLRLRQLMTKYATAPMDLADASLVVAAERMNCRTIFTLDRHFYAYLINDRDYFTVVP